jgi:hypothetical protein
MRRAHPAILPDRRQPRPGVFAVEGPMTDDRPWNEAAAYARNHQHSVVCGPTGADRDQLTAEYRRTLKLAGVPPGSIVRRGHERPDRKSDPKPTVKQHLAAIRMLFDWLVTGQVVATNPACSIRGPKHVVKDRQDHGAGRRSGAQAAGQHRHNDRSRPSRPGVDQRDDVRLRAHRRCRRHARRGLLPYGQALVAPAA